MIRPKVTIIVPVYNVEKYLTCCIGSILSQSFKEIGRASCRERV